MSIFARANDIISANLNDLLDRCEDPEKMIKLLIQEMDEHVERAREALAKALAGEKRLDAEVKKNRAAAAEWQAKAEGSIGRGDEALARQCLVRKKEHESAAATLETQWEVARKTGETLKADYQRLQQKADEARRRRDTLVARQMAAEAQKQMATLGPSMSRAQRSFSKFDQMERKIEAMESEAQAMAELSHPDDDLDGQLRRLEREASVDAELEALKAQFKEKA